MAKRLTTKVSAGASIVLGLGVAGIGLATPASAETTLVYECTTPIGAQQFNITLDTDAPDTAAVGSTETVTPSGTLELNPDTANAMAGFLGWEYVEGDVPGVEAVLSNGTDDTTVTTDLTVDRTHIFDGDGGGWTQDETPELPISGTEVDAEVSTAGTYTISAPDSFDATFTGYDADEAAKGSPIASTCTYVSGEKVIDTIEVSDEPTEPTTDPSTSEPTTSEPSTSEPSTSEPSTSEPTVEADDWFTEPSSLPITEDQQAFTVEGTASHAGTIVVQLLDADKNVLESYTWDVSEGSNSRDFDFVEGTDYARVISQDCVDAEGNTEDDVDSGCNVEYYAPWADITGDGTSSTSSVGSPETPGVVQTDAFQRVSEKESSNAAAYALGGLLLAGAAAGSVVVVRRRSAAQH